MCKAALLVTHQFIKESELMVHWKYSLKLLKIMLKVNLSKKKNKTQRLCYTLFIFCL